MKKHAKLSASGSHRWIACPGSIAAEEGLPNTSSAFADYGTAAHELAEICMTKHVSPFDFEGEMVLNVEVDREMTASVQDYIDYVKLTASGGEVMVEQSVDFSHIVDGGFGTADAIALVGDTLHVIDLKMGKGVRVDAENNSQACLYALGALNEFDFAMGDISKIKMHIVQPRLDHVSEWEITLQEMINIGGQISEAAAAALSDNAPRKSGEKQCQFCKAKATCPELLRHTEESLMTDFDTMDTPPPPDKLTDEQLRRALDAKKLILAWLDSVEEYAVNRITSGGSFPGYKMVEGRANRAWGDAEKAERILTDALGEEAFISKLISPAQAEKLLGKTTAGLLEGLIVKPEGAPVLVQETDKRKSLSITANDFA